MADQPPTDGGTPPRDESELEDVLGESQRILSEQARIVRNQHDQAARILRVMLAVGGVMVTTASILVTIALSSNLGVDVPFPSCKGKNVGFYQCIAKVVFPGDVSPKSFLGRVFVFSGAVLVVGVIPLRLTQATQNAFDVLSPRSIERFALFGSVIDFLDESRKWLVEKLRGIFEGLVDRIPDSVSNPRGEQDGASDDDVVEQEAEDATEGVNDAEDADTGTADTGVDGDERSLTPFQVGPDGELFRSAVDGGPVRPEDVQTLMEGQSECIDGNSELVKYNRSNLGALYQNLMDAQVYLVIGLVAMLAGMLLLLLGG